MSLDAELEQTWERLGIDGGHLAMAPDGTVRAEPNAPTLPSEDLFDAVPEGDGELAPLPRLSSEEVAVGELLGEGGMGRVWLAEQRSLKRQVAVKGLRAEVDGPIGRVQLLREARVTGRLEHPNVVPVHVLVRDEDGSPRMVMKRVDGRVWTELLAESRGAEGCIRDDALETHLRILMQVCHAVHYAHSRGVLHRDLKPDNVMVGEYGEVYLVDWGIAVALGDDGLEDLPRAGEVRGISGTLPYMAPEMVAGEGAGLGVHTDVYLLGSVLHEVLTGTLRHRGDALPQIVHAAWISAPPDYADVDVPSELAELVRAATAKDPADRPATADAFRRALEDFLTHRSARLLATEGEQRLAEARARSKRGEDPLAALREARFAQQQALRIWPGSPTARAGLDAVLTLWMERAIEARDVGTARSLLAEMAPEAQTRWSEAVQSLAAELDARDQKLAALEAAAEQADLGVAARQRRGFGIAFSVLFAIANAALDLAERNGDLGHAGYVFWTGLVAAVVAAPALWMRRTTFPNRASRQLGWSLAMLLCGQVLTFGALMILNVPLRATLAVTLFSLASIIAVKSSVIDRRMGWSAGLALGLGVVGVFVPATVFYGVAIAYGAFFGGGALLSYEQRLASEP